jgi:hypothetical protein
LLTLNQHGHWAADDHREDGSDYATQGDTQHHSTTLITRAMC